MAQSILYHDGNRRLQDAFDSRRIADRLEQVTTHTAFTASDTAFIERAILFFCATVRSSASASSPDFASGKLNSPWRRMSFGTVASTSASRLSEPTSRNMALTSSSFGPMCLRANESMSRVGSRICIGRDYGVRHALQLSSAACAAANRAIGIRNGLQLTYSRPSR